jgi:hypothetical protein
MAQRNWTLEETTMAFALYLILSPKAYDDARTEVRQLAEAIGRTPDAVAMKLWNIAAHDENRVKMGKPCRLTRRQGARSDGKPKSKPTVFQKHVTPKLRGQMLHHRP